LYLFHINTYFRIVGIRFVVRIEWLAGWNMFNIQFTYILILSKLQPNSGIYGSRIRQRIQYCESINSEWDNFLWQIYPACNGQ